MHSAGDLVMCLGDFNGHFARHVDGFYGVHGGYGVGQRKLEGRMFCLGKDLRVKIGLRREDALCRLKWSFGVNLIAAGLRCIWPPLLVRDATRF